MVGLEASIAEHPASITNEKTTNNLITLNILIPLHQST
ncbi:MAG: hypothetical protein OFPII_38590 [Osedax symbiont Rs1]|nr:MAG: hypothetical protein OFPII_38590 [Osedax symbiont Rs1]